MTAFLLGVAGSVVAVGLIVAAGRAYQTRVGRALRSVRWLGLSLLPFEVGKHAPLVVAHGYVHGPAASDRAAVEHGDLIAIIKAHELALRVAPREAIHIRDGRDIGRGPHEPPNLFSVSGPKWNPTASQLLGALGSPITFRYRPRGLAVQTPSMATPEIYETQRESGLPTVCYALVLSGTLQARAGRSQHVVMCAGRTTISTEASLLFLEEAERSWRLRLRLLRLGARRAKPWAALLRVDVATADDERLPAQPSADVFKVNLVRLLTGEDFYAPYEYSYDPSPAPR